MSTAERARKDIFTALMIVTLIVMALGIAVAVLELHKYSVTPKASVESVPRPAKAPDVIKTEGGATSDEVPKGDGQDGATTTTPAAGATGANP